MSPYLKDPKTGEQSVTLTAFAIGFMTATTKLLLSGITFGTITLSQFGGGDYAAAVGAVGAIYVMRRATNKESTPE